MMDAKYLWALALVMACLVAFSGCGGGDDEAAEVAGDEAVTDVTSSDDGKSFSMNIKGEDGKTAKVEFSGDDESFSMNVEGGEGGLKMQMGDSATMPADFPSDVPVYKGLALNMSHASGEGYMIQGTVTDDMDKVVAFFKAEALKQGWTEASAFTQAGDEPMTMLTYTKDERTASVMITKQDGKTSVQITAEK